MADLASVDEEKRLAILHDLNILDTDPSPEFDAVVRLACELFDVPISIISLVDSERQWFKATHGIDLTQTPREFAFCSTTVCSDEPLIVPDATRDERFHRNPFVMGEPNIRFYAGAPLSVASGANVRSLCLIDQKPRHFSPGERRQLMLLREIVTALIRQSQVAQRLSATIDEVQQQARVLEEHKNRLATSTRILDCASKLGKIGAWEHDPATGKLVWSEGMYELHEMSRGDDISFNVLIDCYPEPDRSRLKRLTKNSIAKGTSFEFEGRMRTASGKLRWVRLVSEQQILDGKLGRRFGMKQDITEHKALLDKVSQLASCDDLTGLLNRRELRRQLQELGRTARPLDRRLSLIVVDLDGFKDINDTFGHAAGDACLRHIARRLKRGLPGGSAIARLGGDEFAVLVHDTGESRLAAISERIRTSISKPIKWSGHSFHLSCSIGATSRDAGSSFRPDELLQEADLALYEAKAAGKNCVRFFRPALRLVQNARFDALREVRTALAENRMELYYQAKVNLADHAHGGFEALLRLRRSDGTIVGPGAFQTAMEDPTLSRLLGDYVVTAAVNQAAIWTRSNLPFKSIAINLFPGQIRDRDFPHSLSAMLQAQRLPRGSIEIEITEGTLLSAGSQALSSCNALAAAGFSLAFDDFGTGFASLTHLRDYPVNTIKVDRSFIGDISRGANATVIANAMVSLGRNLGLKVVAEGVETAAQVDFLSAIGCNVAQGFFFDKPADADSATARLLDLKNTSKMASTC
jgi:diguanylate cyclase (GGDEF)-like protein